ncbi:hypothetical protein [Paracoccus sp. NSM]|uniref:hypothetical protein n=1 Tax=Paracoccus sp. NSM TaxID=3457784 RepID=UPI0040350AFC
MGEKAKNFWSFVLEEAKKWAARTAIMLAVSVLVLVVAPFRDRIIAIWQSPAQLDQIATQLDQIAAGFAGQLEQIAAELARATGEDRVIHEAQGLSYVKEPVYVGDPITLNIVVRRTRLGEACVLLNRTAIFTDESNITSAGETLRPARQVTVAETAVRLSLDVPPQVQPGRVTVYLSLEFDCAGRRVFDQTRPVAFALLEQPERIDP